MGIEDFVINDKNIEVYRSKIIKKHGFDFGLSNYYDSYKTFKSCDKAVSDLYKNSIHTLIYKFESNQLNAYYNKEE